MKTTLPSSPVRPLPEYLPAVAVPLPESQIEASTLFGRGVELREYLRLLIKYRVVIIAAVGLGLVIALIAAFTVSPRYTASSKMRIGTYEPLLGSTRIEEMLQQKSQESNYLETQIEEIRSYSLVDRILSDEEIRQGLFGVVDTAEMTDSPERVSDYRFSIREIQNYLGAVEIRPIRRTSLVVVEATAKSAELAALMANRHATEYIDWVRDKRVEQQSRGLTFLKGQADELREKVVSIEREMADYAEANSIIAVNKDENITAQRMAHLNRKLTDATAQRIEAENKYKEAERSLSEDAAAAGFDDSTLQSMRQDLAKYQAEYGQLSSKFTPQYPKVQQLSAQIAGLKVAMREHRKGIVAGLKARYLASLEEERNLNQELELQKTETFDLSKRQVQYNVLQRELTSSRGLLESVLQQMKETSLSVESKASNVAIVDLAVIPAIPSYPRKKIWLLFGLLGGLFIGVAAALVLSYLDDTVRTPEDAVRLIGLPNLGVVPSFDIEALPVPAGAGAASARASIETEDIVESDGPLISRRTELSSKIESSQTRKPRASEESGADANLPIVFVNNPRSLASEAYRTIRTAVLLSQAGQPPRTILVTSAQSSEGKTTSSVNLAASLASAGGRVVLVDADLRRPSVHRHLGRGREGAGLVDVITGQRELSEVLVHNVVKRITFLPSGRIPPNPAELLGSLEMASIIDTLSSQFDYVIIDSPPILPVTDSVILSRYVDGVVMVVRGASTPRKVVSDACGRLRAVGARAIGTILNDVDVTGGDYYYYSQYYYSYYSRDTEQGDGPNERLSA